MDPCFSRPNFDSLKHVLTVLSSNNAEQEVEEVGHSARLHCPAAAHRRAPTRHCRHPLACPLPCSSSPQPNGTALTHTRVICVCYCLFVSCSLMHVQLRDQRASIEALVDAVVEGYHSGFNTSIHNYSRILRLFTQSKMQVRCRGGWVGAMRLRQLRLQPQLDTHRLLFCVPALSHPHQTRRSTPPPPLLLLLLLLAAAAAAAAAGVAAALPGAGPAAPELAVTPDGGAVPARPDARRHAAPAGRRPGRGRGARQGAAPAGVAGARFGGRGGAGRDAAAGWW